MLARFQPANRIRRYLAFYQKGIGVILLGFAPFVVVQFFPWFGQVDDGLFGTDWSKAVVWITGGSILGVVPYYSARKASMQAFYPQIRAKEWTYGLLIVNACVWGCYLFSYEFLFRGYLLQHLLLHTDVVTAVVITTTISTLTHMPKGAVETFGTIPFSVILCMAAINTHSLWAGFFIHVVLALSNDFWAIRFNPAMNVRTTFNGLWPGPP